MAFKKSISNRLFTICRIVNPSLTNRCITLPAAKAIAPSNPNKAVPDPGDDSISRRFIHRRTVYQSCEAGPDYSLQSLRIGEGLLEKLRGGMDIVQERINLDGLIPPPFSEEKGTVTVEDARKLLKLSQMETVKDRLREVDKACVTYEEFLEICSHGWWSKDHAKEVAKMLDQSGNVVVLGNVVFLRPEQEK